MRRERQWFVSKPLKCERDSIMHDASSHRLRGIIGFASLLRKAETKENEMDHRSHFPSSSERAENIDVFSIAHRESANPSLIFPLDSLHCRRQRRRVVLPAMRSFRFRLYSLSPPLLCCKWSRELRLHRYAMLMMTTKIALGRYHMRLSEKSRCLPCLHAPATGSLSFLRGHLHKSL